MKIENIQNLNTCFGCGSKIKDSSNSLHVWEIEYECGCKIQGAIDVKTHGDVVIIEKTCTKLAENIKEQLKKDLADAKERYNKEKLKKDLADAKERLRLLEEKESLNDKNQAIKPLEDYTDKEKIEFFDKLYRNAQLELEELEEKGYSNEDNAHYAWEEYIQILAKDHKKFWKYWNNRIE